MKVYYKRRKSLSFAGNEYEDKLNYLQQKYPKCFTCPPYPLAIEIHKELQVLEKNIISRTKINRILARYVRSQDKPPNGGSLMLSIVAASVDKWYHKNLTKIS